MAAGPALVTVIGDALVDMDHAFGRMPRAHATAEGIDLSRSPADTEPIPLAVLSLCPAGMRRLRLLLRRHRGPAVDTGRDSLCPGRQGGTALRLGRRMGADPPTAQPHPGRSPDPPLTATDLAFRHRRVPQGPDFAGRAELMPASAAVGPETGRAVLTSCSWRAARRFLRRGG
ncbi:hypothetical protein [Streptomyces sp. MAI_2237]